MLNPGVIKKEVLNIMGTKTGKNSRKINNPYQVSSVERDAARYDVISYYTKYTWGQDTSVLGSTFTVERYSNTTPLIFLDGKLKGYGHEFAAPILRY